MESFSKRNNLKKEYSGYGVASKNLRNRLLLLYGLPYSGNEYRFGVGNTNWIHEVAFSKDLQMHFGKKFAIEDFRDETLTTYDEVFDFVELYYNRALHDIDSRKRLELFQAICSAFNNSGSVYEFDKDGKIILRVDDQTASSLTETVEILDRIGTDAKQTFIDLVSGLISRSKEPTDVVKDMSITFEDYCKKITTQNTFENALKTLKEKLDLHPSQIKLIDNLMAYRGDSKGVVHAGNGPVPKEEDALWYIESLIAQIKYFDRKLKPLLDNK